MNTVRIPADVDRADRLVANLTARQLLVLAAAGLLLYAAWAATRTLVPLPVFAVAAVPVGVGAALLALGQRDGVSLDRLALAAARWRATPRHQVCAPEGTPAPPPWLATRATATGHDSPARQPVSLAPLHLPARDVTDTGVVDLGADGLAAIAACSTVNFALRTPAEQDALVAAFGRYLHSLTTPVQILIRTERLDLTGHVHDLHARAPHLPHPALAQAAYDHADYLAQLAAGTELLHRHVLLILRDAPTGPGLADGLGGTSPLAGLARSRAARRTRQASPPARRAAQARLARRLTEAADLLAPAGITVTPLGAGAATSVLAAACNPASLLTPSDALAAPSDVITSTATITTSGDNDDEPGGPAEAGNWVADTDPTDTGNHDDGIGGGYPASTPIQDQPPAHLPGQVVGWAAASAHDQPDTDGGTGGGYPADTTIPDPPVNRPLDRPSGPSPDPAGGWTPAAAAGHPAAGDTGGWDGDPAGGGGLRGHRP